MNQSKRHTPVIISPISDILIQALETFFPPEPWQIHLGKYFLTGDSLRPLLWILCHPFAVHCIGPRTTSNSQDHDILVQYNIERKRTTILTSEDDTIYLNFSMFKVLNAKKDYSGKF